MIFHKKLDGFVNLSLNALSPSPKELPLFDEILEIIKLNNKDLFTENSERFDQQTTKNEIRN